MSQFELQDELNHPRIETPLNLPKWLSRVCRDVVFSVLVQR